MPQPSGFIPPCLPSKAERPPSGPDWVHEIKLDGYRLMVRRDGQRIRCYTKNGHDWADRFPAIVDAALRLKSASCLIDGEAVVLDVDGTSDFSALRLLSREAVLVAFDLLELDGEDVRGLSLIERKRRLKALLGPGGKWRAIQYSDHLTGDGAAIFGHVCKLGLEGIVSKRVDSPYRSGPSRTWLKSKNPASEAVQREQEEEWRQLKPGSPIMRHYKDTAIISICRTHWKCFTNCPDPTHSASRHGVRS
jgi:bifunctional non-homologous end joining protein LigD